MPVDEMIRLIGQPFEVPKPTTPETFEELVQRRIRNLIFMDRLLDKLTKFAPGEESRNNVHEARECLSYAIYLLRGAVKGGE